MVSEYNMVDIFGFREQWRQVNKKKDAPSIQPGALTHYLFFFFLTTVTVAAATAPAKQIDPIVIYSFV